MKLTKAAVGVPDIQRLLSDSLTYVAKRPRTTCISAMSAMGSFASTVGLPVSGTLYARHKFEVDRIGKHFRPITLLPNETALSGGMGLPRHSTLHGVVFAFFVEALR
jgi:hypothetical protein